MVDTKSVEEEDALSSRTTLRVSRWRRWRYPLPSRRRKRRRRRSRNSRIHQKKWGCRTPPQTDVLVHCLRRSLGGESLHRDFDFRLRGWYTVRVCFVRICRGPETRVVDSRVTPDGMTIRWRRECEKCHYRFSTIEEMEPRYRGREAERSARVLPRSKLKRGILQSLTKRPYTQEFRSPDSYDRARYSKKKTREVTSRVIGEIVIRRLRSFDKVAYIRFASIYRAFEDVKTFASEIRTLESANGVSRRRGRKVKR